MTVVILFTCCKLWGLPDEVILTITLEVKLGDPVISVLLEMDIVTLCDTVVVGEPLELDEVVALCDRALVGEPLELDEVVADTLVL